MRACVSARTRCVRVLVCDHASVSFRNSVRAPIFSMWLNLYVNVYLGPCVCFFYVVAGICVCVRVHASVRAIPASLACIFVFGW